MPERPTTAAPAIAEPSPLWRQIRGDISSLIGQVGTLESSLAEAEKRNRKNEATLLLGMLDVMDDFERVLANIEPREADADRQARLWVGNFRGVRRRLEQQLRDRGVARIESPAGKAVPGLHTVIETCENAGLEDDTIVDEFKKGYLWQGEVLRKAEVIAVRNRTATTSSGTEREPWGK